MKTSSVDVKFLVDWEGYFWGDEHDSIEAAHATAQRLKNKYPDESVVILKQTREVVKIMEVDK